MTEEQKNETIPVQLWVADRQYRLRIKKEDEEKVRFAVSMIDKKINDLKKNFAGRDHQDFIAMCLLMYATEQAVDIDALNTVQKDFVNSMIQKVDGTLDKES